MPKTIYIADWIIPITSPSISNAALVIEDDLIVDFGSSESILKQYDSCVKVENFKNSVIVPSWVNAHCHLELSLFKGQVTANEDFVDWIRELLALRAKVSKEELINAAHQSAVQLADSGCALVADITNGDLLDPDLFQDLFQRVVFYEKLGFRKALADTIFNEATAVVTDQNSNARLTPHAPYSTSADLIKRIAVAEDFFSIHLAESPQETDFLRDGSGSFKKFLLERNAFDEKWFPPEKSPVAYLDDLDLLSQNSLLVHGVQVTTSDLKMIRESSATVCLCGRSNEHTNVGDFPILGYLQQDIPLCIGTDSLASNIDLDMNNEIWYIYNKFKQISPTTLLQMATLNGARILGFGNHLGSIEKGKDARFNVFLSDSQIKSDPDEFVVSKSWSAIKCF